MAQGDKGRARGDRHPDSAAQAQSLGAAAVLEQIAEGVIVTDETGTIVLVNDAAARLHGVKRLDVQPDAYTEAYHLLTLEGAPHPPAELPLARAVRGETVVDARWRIRRPDGSEVLAIGTARPLLDEAGRQRGAILTVRDDTARHEAEQALARSEARFREQFENANDFIFTADLDMRVTSCNPAVAAAVGRSPAELIGRSIGEFVPPEVWERTRAMLAAKLAGQDATQYEVEVFDRDGRRMTWEINSRLTRDESGRPNGLHAIGRDITERARAERELRESEARLRALTDHLPGGMVYQIASGVDGSERRFLYVSQSNEQLTGVSAEALLADPMRAYNLIHPDDRPLLAAAEETAIRTRSPFDVEVRFHRADGEPRWCRIISAPREQPDGSLIWDGIQIDVTDQKQTEEALRLRGEEFSALADHIPTLCWMAYADGHIFWYNRRWYEYTGTAAENQEGWGWESVHDPDMLPAVLARWKRSLDTGEPFEMTFPLKGRDGAFRPFLTRIVPIRDEAGEIVRWFGTNVDISEQVEAERLLEQRVAERTAELQQAHEQLRQSQKLEAMGQLTGGVAHDFNNLLTPIIGGLDLLKRRGLGGEREQRLIDGALQSAERAKTLVQRLLAFARRQPLKAGAVDVAALVTGMADLIESTSGPQIKLSLDLALELPAAQADPNQLEMAILNLSVNARDAMPDGGTLTIAAAADAIEAGHRSKLKPGDYVRLSVADTGLGMDEQTLARAIEPFFSTKGIGKGTGLGLSMVHGLAAQLGGAFAIDSRPGLGTRVELWLPKSDVAADAEAAAPAKAPSNSAKGRALLVDDEDLVRMSTADMLTDLGYEVVEASSASAALAQLGDGLEFNLVVTDHLMPGMTGADLARLVRERWPAIPVLIVSGYAETDGLAPDLPRLSKPFRQHDLAASLGAITAGSDRPL